MYGIEPGKQTRGSFAGISGDEPHSHVGRQYLLGGRLRWPVVSSPASVTLAGITAGGSYLQTGESRRRYPGFRLRCHGSRVRSKHPWPSGAPSIEWHFFMLNSDVNDAGRFVAASSDRFFDDSHKWSTSFTVPPALNALRVCCERHGRSGNVAHLTVDSMEEAGTVRSAKGPTRR